MPAPLAKGEYELSTLLMHVSAVSPVPSQFKFHSFYVLFDQMPTCLQAPAPALLHPTFSLVAREALCTGLTTLLLQAS